MAARSRARFGPPRVPARRNQISRSISYRIDEAGFSLLPQDVRNLRGICAKAIPPPPRCAAGKWCKLLGAKGIVAIVIVALLGVLLVAPPSQAKATRIELQAGPFAPGARGEIAFTVSNGVLAGRLEAEKLPAQGAHAFYVLWFVRADTGDKAFLGPLVGDDSILFFAPGDGEMRFRAPAFTDGP